MLRIINEFTTPANNLQDVMYFFTSLVVLCSTDGVVDSTCYKKYRQLISICFVAFILSVINKALHGKVFSGRLDYQHWSQQSGIGGHLKLPPIFVGHSNI